MSQDLKRRALHGLAWYGGSRVALQAFTWATTIIVARLVSPGDYGLLGMATSYLVFVAMVNELGFGATIVQREELSAEDLDTLFWVGLGMSFVLYGLTLAAAPLVARFFRRSEVIGLLTILGLSLVLTGLRTVPWNLLTRAVNFKARSLLEMVGNVAGALVTMLLALRGAGVWALVIGLLLPQVVTTVGAYAFARWRPRWRINLAALRKHLPFSSGVAATQAVWYLQDSADQIIVGRTLGEQALGVYSLALRMGVDLPARVVQVLNQVAYPAYARLQGDPEGLTRHFLTSVRLVGLAIVPASLGLVIVAPELTRVLLTEKWSGVVLPLQIITLGALPRTLQSLAAPVVMARGHSLPFLQYNLLCLLVLPPSYALGAAYGLKGVCLVWVTVAPVLLAYWVMRTKGIVGYAWRDLWLAVRPASLASTFMVMVVLSVRLVLVAAGVWPRLVATVGAGVLSYLGGLWWLEPRLPREIAGLFVRAKPADDRPAVIGGPPLSD